eukprot:m.83117 g.83117  ORF g.83117 m.83117 type:complete len:135 (+) comp21099_c0_seq3:224-628(+)
MFLYSAWYDPSFTINGQTFPLEKNWFKQGKVCQVSAASSYAFYRALFEHGITMGMTAYEVDFLMVDFLLTQAFVEDAFSAEAWMTGMATAALELNVTIQYCWELPSDLLQALKFPVRVKQSRRKRQGETQATNL